MYAWILLFFFSTNLFFLLSKLLTLLLWIYVIVNKYKKKKIGIENEKNCWTLIYLWPELFIFSIWYLEWFWLSIWDHITDTHIHPHTYTHTSRHHPLEPKRSRTFINECWSVGLSRGVFGILVCLNPPYCQFTTESL